MGGGTCDSASGTCKCGPGFAGSTCAISLGPCNGTAPRSSNALQATFCCSTGVVDRQGACCSSGIPCSLLTPHSKASFRVRLRGYIPAVPMCAHTASHASRGVQSGLDLVMECRCRQRGRIMLRRWQCNTGQLRCMLQWPAGCMRGLQRHRPGHRLHGQLLPGRAGRGRAVLPAPQHRGRIWSVRWNIQFWHLRSQPQAPQQPHLR